MKELLIHQCPDRMRWYANLVAERVPFLGDEGTEYRSREPSGYINFVQYADADIVERCDDRDTNNKL